MELLKRLFNALFLSNELNLHLTMFRGLILFGFLTGLTYIFNAFTVVGILQAVVGILTYGLLFTLAVRSINKFR